MVSLKYETVNPGDCISLVSGENLCRPLNIMKAIIIFFILSIAGLLTFKKRIKGSGVRSQKPNHASK